MSYNTIRILNVDIIAIREDELLRDMQEGVLVTPNLDHLVKMQHDEDFWHCYQNAEWVICDSEVLWLCSKLQKRSIPEAIPGSSFFTKFCEYHKEDSTCKIFLLGAMDNVALKAQKCINEKIGREIIVGAYSPSYGFEKNIEENNRIHQMINESGANVVLVGVGAPKQEKWIFAHKDQMQDVKLWMALGATIDFEAGNLKRAPKIFRVLALEWLFRLFSEPKRLFHRYIIDDMKFFPYYFKQLMGKYKNPFN